MSVQNDLNQFAKAIDGMSFSEAIDILEKNKELAATAGPALTKEAFPKLIQKSIDEIDGLSEDLKKVPDLEEARMRTDAPVEAAAAKKEVSRIKNRTMTLFQNDIPRLTRLAHLVSFPSTVYANPEFQKALQKYLILMSDKVPPTWHALYDYTGSLRNVYLMTRFMPRDRSEKTLKKLYGTISFTWRGMDAYTQQGHYPDVNDLLKEMSADRKVRSDPLFRSVVRNTNSDYSISLAAIKHLRTISEGLYQKGHIGQYDMAKLHDIYNKSVAQKTIGHFEELLKGEKDAHAKSDLKNLITLAKFITRQPGVHEKEIKKMLEERQAKERLGQDAEKRAADQRASYPARQLAASILTGEGAVQQSQKNLRGILDSANRGSKLVAQHMKTQSPESFLGLLTWLHKDGMLTRRELSDTVRKVNDLRFVDAKENIRKGWSKRMDFDFKNTEMTPKFYAYVPRGLSSGVVDYVTDYLKKLDDLREKHELKNQQEMESKAAELLKKQPGINRPLSMNEGIGKYYRERFGEKPLLIPSNTGKNGQTLYNGRDFRRITSAGVSAAKPPWKNLEELHREAAAPAIAKELGIKRLVLPVRKIPYMIGKI